LEILWRIDSRTGGVQEVPQVILLFDKPVIVAVPDDVTEPPQLAELLRSAGLTSNQCNVFVVAPPGDENRLTNLLAGVGFPVTLERRQPGTIRGPFTVKGLLGKEYFRAIAKIGFHYALKHAPNLNGDEPQFQSIRNFIIRGEGPIDQFVSHATAELLIRSPGQRLRRYGHLLTVEADYEKPVMARMQFFRGPDNDPVVWIVSLGYNPSRVDWNQRFGHWFYYFGRVQKGFDGEVQPIRHVDRSLLPGSIQ
jgi:hypothetical protein